VSVTAYTFVVPGSTEFPLVDGKKSADDVNVPVDVG
jgi:hypothetical protein